MLEVFAANYYVGSLGGWRLEARIWGRSTIKTSLATAGGVVSYKSSYLLHSVNYFLLLPALTRQDVGFRGWSLDSEASEDEYEVIGLSDNKDEDDEIVDITSCRSATLILSDYKSISCSPSESESQEGLMFSYRSFKEQGTYLSALQSQLETLRASGQELLEAASTSG